VGLWRSSIPFNSLSSIVSRTNFVSQHQAMETYSSFSLGLVLRTEQAAMQNFLIRLITTIVAYRISRGLRSRKIDSTVIQG
jgi:hypothetical protein